MCTVRVGIITETTQIPGRSSPPVGRATATCGVSSSTGESKPIAAGMGPLDRLIWSLQAR